MERNQRVCGADGVSLRAVDVFGSLHLFLFFGTASVDFSICLVQAEPEPKSVNFFRSGLSQRVHVCARRNGRDFYCGRSLRGGRL